MPTFPVCLPPLRLPLLPCLALQEKATDNVGRLLPFPLELVLLLTWHLAEEVRLRRGFALPLPSLQAAVCG